MDSIEFLAIIAVLAGILAWYIHNVRTSSDGHAGLFALRQNACDPKPDPQNSRNRTIEYAVTQTPNCSGKPETSADHDRQSQRKFRRREEARYRIKDKAARYRPKKATPTH